MTAFSQDLVSMIISLHHFVERYTGDAAVGEDANYLVNKADVVNNSLHFESGRATICPAMRRPANLRCCWPWVTSGPMKPPALRN